MTKLTDSEFQIDFMNKLGIDPKLKDKPITELYTRASVLEKFANCGIKSAGQAFEWLAVKGEFPYGITRRRWQELISILRNVETPVEGIKDEESY